jgi:hypothetical protein
VANLTLAAIEKMKALLLQPGGLNDKVYAIAMRDQVEPREFSEQTVLVRHFAAEASDANTDLPYPQVLLYCNRIENRLEAKFAQFSGRIFLTAEVRASEETLELLDGQTARLAEAVVDSLTPFRGKWTENAAFDGRFETMFDGARVGGRNFIQSARIEIELLAHA